MAKSIKYGVLGGLLLTLTACVSPNMNKNTPVSWQSPKPVFADGMTTAERIRAIAHREHQAWHGSFIDAKGGIRRYQISEAERFLLTDGAPAWQRVMAYWRDSGGMAELSERQNCLVGGLDVNKCRVFAMDSAWSAVFVSYVMAQAGVADFIGSPRHFDYIKHAWQHGTPYAYTNPKSTAPKVGDMLCYVRGKNGVAGFDGLSEYLHTQSHWLTAHCDIVVDVNADDVWLIGGNVMNTVMLRKLPLGDDGLMALPVTKGDCHHNNENACNLNRQNWAVLLKLQVP